jgi:carbon monoxide dehydrogenase subunit G
MIEASDTVHVDASRRAVFEFLDDPNNHVMVTPSLIAVENTRPLENGGKRAEFTYSIGGVKLSGELEETRHEPDDRMVFELRGQLPGEIDIAFEPEGEGTRVTYSARYDVPGRTLERLAEPFVRRYNEREVRTLLGNLKTRLEGEG